MSYTQADVDKVTAAILALASGDQIASVSRNGTTTSYVPQEIEKLERLQVSMQQSVNAAAGTKPGYLLTRTSKGL